MAEKPPFLHKVFRIHTSAYGVFTTRVRQAKTNTLVIVSWYFSCSLIGRPMLWRAICKWCGAERFQACDGSSSLTMVHLAMELVSADMGPDRNHGFITSFISLGLQVRLRIAAGTVV